jgi:hypothetical protein
MVCPSCATENAVANAYCASCGTSLGDASSAAAVPRYGSQQGLVKREIAIVIGGLTAVLFAAWLAWYLLVTTRSPTSVVRAFIESDRAGQYSRQQELIASSWDSRMALNFFQALRQQSGSSPFQNYRIVRTSESRSSNAFVDVELTLGQPAIPFLTPPKGAASGQPATHKIMVTFVLSRQGDDWKIDSSQTLATVVSAIMAQGFQNIQANPPSFQNLPIPPGWPNFGIPPLTPGLPAPGASPPPASTGSPTI